MGEVRRNLEGDETVAAVGFREDRASTSAAIWMSVTASASYSSVVEADQCARKLVDVYTRLLRLGDRCDEVMPMNIGEPAGIPAFLMKSVRS